MAFLLLTPFRCDFPNCLENLLIIKSIASDAVANRENFKKGYMDYLRFKFVYLQDSNALHSFLIIKPKGKAKSSKLYRANLADYFTNVVEINDKLV